MTKLTLELKSLSRWGAERLTNKNLSPTCNDEEDRLPAAGAVYGDHATIIGVNYGISEQTLRELLAAKDKQIEELIQTIKEMRLQIK